MIPPHDLLLCLLNNLRIEEFWLLLLYHGWRFYCSILRVEHIIDMKEETLLVRWHRRSVLFYNLQGISLPEFFVKMPSTCILFVSQVLLIFICEWEVWYLWVWIAVIIHLILLHKCIHSVYRVLQVSSRFRIIEIVVVLSRRRSSPWPLGIRIINKTLGTRPRWPIYPEMAE